MTHHFSRRQLLKGGLAIGISAYSTFPSLAQSRSPDQKLNIAIIGPRGAGGTISTAS